MFSHGVLVDLRQQRGMTRSALHRALVRRGFEGCRARINLWERGVAEPSASELGLLAATLGVPADALLAVGAA